MNKYNSLVATNWYKIAQLDQHLKKEAGLKQDLVKALSTSVLSAVMIIFEMGAISRTTVDQAAKKANLNDQEKRQLEQVVQDPMIMNKAKEFLHPQQQQQMFTTPQSIISQRPAPQPEHPKPNKEHSNRSVSSAPVINLGKELIGRGFKIGYHPNFSYANGFDNSGKQRIGEHATHSLHYKNQAFDISGSSQQNLEAIFDELFKRRHELGISQLIYDKKGKWFGKGNTYSTKAYGGHGNHIHVGFISPGLIRDVKDTRQKVL